jgi:hypothetical protein
MSLALIALFTSLLLGITIKKEAVRCSRRMVIAIDKEGRSPAIWTLSFGDDCIRDRSGLTTYGKVQQEKSTEKS